MDFSITPEQEQLYASMKRLAAEVIAPGAADRDKDGRWDPDVWKQLAAVGNDPYPYSSMATPTLVFEGVQLAGT